MPKLVSQRSFSLLDRVSEEKIFLIEETPFRRCYVVEWKVAGIDETFTKDWCIGKWRSDDRWKEDARDCLKKFVELRIAEQILEKEQRR
jgi:hypothetical protein